ncbi:MAG: MgtC/SapB family protein [Anaerolineales bacterium]|nr:MgtC/SapB family protein [Anaerolineales bacterium]
MITQLLNLEPWWRFAAALLIGALIGLEREFVQQRSGEQEFGGIRTFALMALLGAVAAFLTDQYGPLIFLGAYLGLILLLWASLLSSAIRGEEEGITSEVAALLVPLLGAMMIWNQPAVAAALGVITALILALKPRLHGVARRMSAEDLRATLEFSIITAVVLPLLPNEGFGPFGVLNPFQIWLLVVFISGIGFLGYVLMKFIGTEQGVGITGLLGGLVSSTATTLSFAGRSKTNAGLSTLLAQGIILASCVMFPRVLIEVAVVNPGLVKRVVVPLVAMLIAGLIGFYILWRRGRAEKKAEHGGVELSNPLRLKTAITFGLVFAFVLVAVEAANEYFGSAGVYLASILTGITDVDSITLSVSNLSLKGLLDERVAAIAIIMATIMNTITKAVMAMVLGTPRLRRLVSRAFGVVVLTGLISAAANFFL